jgi:hypothetical protein
MYVRDNALALGFGDYDFVYIWFLPEVYMSKCRKRHGESVKLGMRDWST